jgi:hypothetical protein
LITAKTDAEAVMIPTMTVAATWDDRKAKAFHFIQPTKPKKG